VKPSLRKILADSHIAAIAIAVLLFWAFYSLFQVPWAPLFRAVDFVVVAIATFDIPYSAGSWTFTDRLALMMAASYLFSASVNFTVAWLLWRWAYSEGPFLCLRRYTTAFPRRDHV
jgi:hypothetical protein